MKYRMYVDEAGDTVLRIPLESHRQYLCLTGVIIEYDYVRSVIAPQMEALKAKYFEEHHPDEPVVFHRTSMMKEQGAFVIFSAENRRQQFNDELLGLLRNWDYNVISVCMDKHRCFKDFAHRSYELYHLCLRTIMTNYAAFLRRLGQRGDVLIESRGTSDDIALREEYKRLYAEEELHHVLSSKQLIIKAKASNIAGLQIADLLVHESRTEILHENKRGGKPAPFAERILDVLQSKYEHQNEQIWGKRFLP